MIIFIGLFVDFLQNYRDHLPFLPPDNSRETFRKLEKFVAKALGSDRIIVGDSESKVEPLLAGPTSVPQVIIMSSKTQTNMLWRRIAYHFGNRLQFLQIKADAEWAEESDLLKSVVGDVTVPSVLVRGSKKDDDASMPLLRYAGDMKNYAEIVEWLTPLAGESEYFSASNDEDSEADAKSSKTKSYREITAEEFADILTDTTGEEFVHVVAVRRETYDEPDLSDLQKRCYGAIVCVQFICPSDKGEVLDESLARFCPGERSSGGIPADPYLLVVPFSPADRAKVKT